MSPLRVLLVEDDDDNRELMAEVLAGVGFEVVTAASGIEGLRSLLVTGWDGEALALGFGCALGVLAIGLTVASLSLKERMVRT